MPAWSSRDPSSLAPSAKRLAARPKSSPTVESAPTAPAPSAPAAAPAPPAEDEPTLEPLAGVSARIAAHMAESLELPTATSVRTIAAKVLFENRAVLNEHMEVRALGKASFTHVVAFALARVLAEMPQMLAAYVEVDGKPLHQWWRWVAAYEKGPDGQWKTSYIMAFADSTK